MLFERVFIRNQDFEDLFEDFFVSAVVTILGIRFFLSLTHYPQLSGQGLHIAHMLWGGLFMFVSMIFLLTFLGKTIKRIAAFIGGIGFGAFIDELGKFITSDNNYFYQPTIAIIYIIFIGIYLLFKLYNRYTTFSKHEYLINSLDIMTETVVHDLDPDEKAKAQFYLKKADQKDPITHAISKLFMTLQTIPRPRPNPLIRVEKNLKNLYFNLIRKKWYVNLLIIFFIIQSIISFFIILIFIFGVVELFVAFKFQQVVDRVDIFEIFSLLFNSISGIFIILGVSKFRKNRLLGYQMFKWSMIISIFFVQVFSFYQNQMTAFTGLIFDVLILNSLNYMIEMEKSICLGKSTPRHPHLTLRKLTES